MKQLSGLDASFLYMETASQFGHVSSLSLFAKPEDDPTYEPLAAWRAQIERRRCSRASRRDRGAFGGIGNFESQRPDPINIVIGLEHQRHRRVG